MQETKGIDVSRKKDLPQRSASTQRAVDLEISIFVKNQVLNSIFVFWYNESEKQCVPEVELNHYNALFKRRLYFKLFL